MNVETNVCKTFLKLVKKYFPRNSSFHKIFNNNTIKISYSSLRNIGLIIGSHSIHHLESILHLKAKEYGCNCRNKESCPLQNQCLTPKVIDEVTVINNCDDKKRYTLALKIQPLRSDIATIHEISMINFTLNVESYRSIFGS